LRADSLIGEKEMREKRMTPRAHVDIYLNKYVGGIPYMARASDISPQGVRLAHLIEPQHNGKQVGVQFQLPGSTEVIYAEGEIVREWMRVKGQGYGIRFTGLHERHRKLIDAFVASNENEEQ
jgi:hypothetical protein